MNIHLVAKSKMCFDTNRAVQHRRGLEVRNIHLVEKSKMCFDTNRTIQHRRGLEVGNFGFRKERIVLYV